MMRKSLHQKLKDSDKEILKPLFAILGGLAICAAAMIFLQMLTQDMKKDYIAAQAGSLRAAVNSVGAEITAQAQDATDVREIIRRQDNTGAVTWVAFDSDGLIFDKNDLVTEQTGLKDYSSLADNYIRSGGKNIVKLMDLLKAGGNFSAVAQRTRAQGSELLTIGTYRAADQEDYRVGTCVSLNWLYAQSNLLKRILYLQILTGVLCALILALIVFCALRHRSKNIALAALRRENAAKNRLVIEQWEKLSGNDGESQNRSADDFTGLYSRDFLASLLQKTAARNPEGFGVILIGFGSIDAGAFQNASRTVLSAAYEKSVCAVAAQDKIAVLVYGMDETELQTQARQFSDALEEIFEPEQFRLGVCFKHAEMTVQQAYDEALRQI